MSGIRKLTDSISDRSLSLAERVESAHRLCLVDPEQALRSTLRVTEDTQESAETLKAMVCS